MSSQSGPEAPSHERAFTSAGAQDRGMDFWGAAVRRKWFVLMMAGLGLSLAYLQFLRATPVFQSQARLLVKKPSLDLPVRSLEGEDDSRRELERQIVLIRSEKILDRAVSDHDLLRLESLKGSYSDPVKKIISGLAIQEEVAGVLDARYSGPDGADCRTILEAVVDSYRQFLDENQARLSEEAVALIHRAKDELLEKLTQVESEYREFRATAPPIWRVDGETNVFLTRLAGIEEARAKLFLDRTTMQAEASAIENALKEGGSREVVRLLVMKMAEQSAAQEGSTPSVAAQIFPMLLEEQLLLDFLGPDHPKVKEIRKRITFTRQFLQSSEKTPQESDTADDRDFVEVYLDSLKKQIKASELKEQELNTLLENENEQYRRSQFVERQDQSFRERIAQHKALFDAVVKRLSEIELVKDLGGYRVEIISSAKLGVQIAPSLPRFMIVGSLLGVACGIVIALIRESSDNRFLAPEDIHRQIGAPVIGHVPEIRTGSGFQRVSDPPVDSTVCTFHQSRSQCAEAFRAIRTALYFNSSRSMQKVLQVTSPRPGDGKSTLAANLAVSIANSGKKVLLVDTDFRRPRIHEIFGLPNVNGLASSIASGDGLDPLDAVHQYGIQNLSILTSGTPPENPSELLTSAAFEQFLHVARDKYDYVIIDSPPVLAVTDPCAVAARVDGVILAIRLGKHARATATQSAAMLLGVGAKVIGVVVNGRGGFKKRTGYASGYHSSQYGYGYGYSDKESAAYYANGTDDKRSRPGPPILTADDSLP